MKKKRRVLQLCLAFVVMVLMVQLTGLKASAKPYLDFEKSMMICQNLWYPLYAQEADGYKIVKATSSNEKVIALRKDSTGDFIYSAQEKGKSIITVKLKKGKEVLVLRRSIRVYANKPFEYIKYDDNNLYKGNEHYLPGFYVKPRKKLTWKLKEGYKLTGAFYASGAIPHELKNGQRMRLKKANTVFFHIQLPNKEIVNYSLFLIPADAGIYEWDKK